MASESLIPVIARRCADRLKVLPGVEIHGDRRADLEDALLKLLNLWCTEGIEIRWAALRECRRHGPGVSFRDRLRLVVRERMGLTVPLRELPRDAEQPILVELCLDLLRSSDFAEIEATDAELAREIQAALPDAPRTLDALFQRRLAVSGPRPRISLPSDPLLEESARRFLEWLRGGGPPSEGPGGSCPPPAVPV